MPLEFTMRLSAAMMEAMDFQDTRYVFYLHTLARQGDPLAGVDGPRLDGGEREDDINCILINVEPNLIPS